MLKVLWKETAFPRWRATNSRWNRYVVSLVSSVTAVIGRPSSCTSSTAWWFQDPAVYGNWNEDVAVGQLPVFGFLVKSGVVSCRPRHTSLKLKNKPLLQWDQQATGGRKLTWINSLFSRKHHLVGVTLATKRPIPSYAVANVNKYMRCMFIRSELS